MSKVKLNRIVSIIWYVLAAMWALVSVSPWLKGEYDWSVAMTHSGIAFILANVFELRSELGKIGEK